MNNTPCQLLRYGLLDEHAELPVFCTSGWPLPKCTVDSPPCQAQAALKGATY